MILLLEVKLIGTGWLPRRILDENNIRQALDNLIIDKRFNDWRIKRISEDDVVWINTQILTKWM